METQSADSAVQRSIPSETPPPRLRIVLADDHKDLLDAIRALLTPEFEIVNSVSNGVDLIGSVRNWKPDAVVSDIQMPGINGIEACRRIIQEGLCSAVVILTMYNEVQLVGEALAAGIRGYVSKVDAGEELIPALHSVLGGSTYFSLEVRKKRSE